jgi:predicted AAA+ superfamily ATPase
LHPFSVAELVLQKNINAAGQIFNTHRASDFKEQSQLVLTRLMEFSGFPEPYFKGETAFLRQWRATRRDRMINQDLAALENIQNLSFVEHLALLLPERIGAPLSLNALREDLEVHFTSVKRWLESLARIFYGFFLKPYSAKLTRALKKEAKWYLFDWSEVDDPGARFENLMAIHLKKTVDYVNDLGLDTWDLFFLRDREKREVDFLITKNRKPHVAVECKLSDDKIPQSLVYFAQHLKIPQSYLIVFDSQVRHRTTLRDDVKIEVMPAWQFLQGLV